MNNRIIKVQKGGRSALAVSLSIYPFLRCPVCVPVKRVGIKSLIHCVVFAFLGYTAFSRKLRKRPVKAVVG